MTTYPLEDSPVARAMIAAARAEADVYQAKILAVASSPRSYTVEGNIQITENVVKWASHREYFTGLADMAEYLISGKSTAGIADVAKRVVTQAGGK